jgi:hypothetical protein
VSATSTRNIEYVSNFVNSMSAEGELKKVELALVDVFSIRALLVIS